MKTDFRLVEIKDFNMICQIYEKAIQDMNAQNINQWDELYPTHDDIYADMIKRQMYLLSSEDMIISVVTINENQEKEYKTGQWQYTSDKMAVIHRLCVNPDHQKKVLKK